MKKDVNKINPRKENFYSKKIQKLKKKSINKETCEAKDRL